MITVHSSKERELVGLSTDVKPNNVGANMLFLELDTGDIYYFDGTEWDKIASSEGGGGKGSTPLVIGISDPETQALDKTWQEIADAFPNAYVFMEIGNSDSFMKMALASVGYSEGEYYVSFGSGSSTLTTETADGYPSQGGNPK